MWTFDLVRRLASSMPPRAPDLGRWLQGAAVQTDYRRLFLTDLQFLSHCIDSRC